MAGGLIPSVVLVLRVTATMAPSILGAHSVCAERRHSPAADRATAGSEASRQVKRHVRHASFSFYATFDSHLDG
jgi:hypothetical protein